MKRSIGDADKEDVPRRDMVAGIAGGMLLASLPGELALAKMHETPCMGQDQSYSYLDITNAEDLAPIRGTRWLITSSTTRDTTAPPWDPSKKKRKFKRGGIYAVDRRDRSFQRVWPDKGQAIRRDPGFGDCDAPIDAGIFSCSGLHLAEGKAGIHRLYAVNEDQRHSIEIFEVKETEQFPSLTWVGALLVPHPCRPNSVAVLNDSSLFVTCLDMLDDPDSLSKIRAGKDTGFLLNWHPATGWKKLDGTDSSAPNGVLVSPDGATLYYALSGSRKLIVQPLGKSGRRTGVNLRLSPDNLRWDDHGMIWVGGNADLEAFEPKICRIDPNTLTAEYIDLPSTPDTFGRCSVATKIDREIWLGSFDCDRIAILAASA